MHDIGVEILGHGALKLTEFLREAMQRSNITFESLYTIRTLKEVGVIRNHSKRYIAMHFFCKNYLPRKPIMRLLGLGGELIILCII